MAQLKSIKSDLMDMDALTSDKDKKGVREILAIRLLIWATDIISRFP